jgi:RNA polymerase sigma-70 factor (ECF subfamily)
MANNQRKEKFTEAVLDNIPALNRFAYSLCQNAAETEDLVSETIVKAFEKFEGLREEQKLKQWLFKILRNQFISNYRRNKRVIALNDIQTVDNHDEGSFSLYEAISKSDFVNETDAEKKFISKVTQDQIQTAINELPEEFRITLILCDVEDFSYAEISQILKIPIGTVRSRIARARIILQKKLWLLAKELGIGSPKTKAKDEYICTCGKEGPEVHHSNIIN